MRMRLCIACLPELAHRRIDKGNACHAALPCPQQAVILAPVEPVELGLQIAPLQFGIEIEKRVREFAPAEFRAEIVDIVRRQVAAVARRVPDPVHRDLAPVKMRRQARDMGLCRKVAALLVASDAAIQKGLKTRLGTGLADVPVRGQHLAPVLGRQQVKIID